jgi:2-hydroxy-3-keto-5-methylthiopentenyl-1-phosphate phosphatase
MILKIPLLGIETNVSKDPSIEEIIQAVSEASVSFCIASDGYGSGIREELEAVEDKTKDK